MSVPGSARASWLAVTHPAACQQAAAGGRIVGVPELAPCSKSDRRAPARGSKRSAPRRTWLLANAALERICADPPVESKSCWRDDTTDSMDSPAAAAGRGASLEAGSYLQRQRPLESLLLLVAEVSINVLSRKGVVDLQFRSAPWLQIGGNRSIDRYQIQNQYHGVDLRLRWICVFGGRRGARRSRRVRT